MSVNVFIILLFAACLHASWNAIIKSGSNKHMTTCLVTTTAAIIALIFLPFLPQPHLSSWPYLACSVVLQIIYFSLIAKTYHVTDMAQSYPLMRGTAPFLVAIFSTVVLAEKLHFGAWCGITLICLGIFAIIARWHQKNRIGIYLTFINAVVIASYTLIDGIGVRASHSPIAYTLWIYLLTGLVLGVWMLKTQKMTFIAYAQKNWHLGLMGGIGSIISYALALWAMTLYPIAMISAFRETSILFALLISRFMLKEKFSLNRIIAAIFIFTGAMLLKLS
ncbi:DMT family transporter [Acinetobacter sp. MD2(2019)]|uniref:DMT family transporter n=1 Tax=Acinetobacter sp. MD2(2019) TaxID=2605273 RepID=UPI002D1F1B43|nr:DMT family transporter [Acinetobacter sp. MD2(2019)]MEB3753450.1 EamA family transporter [Acinetobacter sp. MD2(2019)]